MRVAILNRKRDVHPGGDLTQIDATIAALARINIHAEYAPEGWDAAWLRTFDLAHIFHCNFGWSMYNWEGVMGAGARIPYVLTPIFYPSIELGASAAEIRNIIYDARYVTPNSYREWDELMSVLGVDARASWDYPPVCAIPNGTDEMFHGSLTNDTARVGVIAVAPRLGDKNTGIVEAACAELGMRFQVITGITDRSELAYRYSRASVFVNASLSERMSLTTGEALCAGCRVIDTTENWGGGWYGPGLVTVRPDDYKGMVEAISNAFWSAEWDYAPNVRAQQLTWGVVAGQLARVYQRALKGWTR